MFSGRLARVGFLSSGRPIRPRCGAGFISEKSASRGLVRYRMEGKLVERVGTLRPRPRNPKATFPTLSWNTLSTKMNTLPDCQLRTNWIAGYPTVLKTARYTTHIVAPLDESYTGFQPIRSFIFIYNMYHIFILFLSVLLTILFNKRYSNQQKKGRIPCMRRHTSVFYRV